MARSRVRPREVVPGLRREPVLHHGRGVAANAAELGRRACRARPGRRVGRVAPMTHRAASHGGSAATGGQVLVVVVIVVVAFCRVARRASQRRIAAEVVSLVVVVVVVVAVRAVVDIIAGVVVVVMAKRACRVPFRLGHVGLDSQSAHRCLVCAVVVRVMVMMVVRGQPRCAGCGGLGCGRCVGVVWVPERFDLGG